MGADLYIEGVSTDDGYFRDCYNHTSVLWRLITPAGKALSWWVDVVPLSSQGIMNVQNAEKFLAMIDACRLDLPNTLEWFKQNNLVCTNDADIAIWHDAWKNELRELISFLRRAIDQKKRIECSL